MLNIGRFGKVIEEYSATIFDSPWPNNPIYCATVYVYKIIVYNR